MRATAISMAAVLVLTAGVCVFSMTFIARVCAGMEEIHAEVMDLAETGREEAAREALGRMAQRWKKHEDMLAALVPHASIYEITSLLIEADACLAAGDRDDFAAAMAHLSEAVSRIEQDERFHLSNILQVC